MEKMCGGRAFVLRCAGPITILKNKWKKELGSSNLKESDYDSFWWIYFYPSDVTLALFAPKARRKLLPHHKAPARTSGANLSRNPMKSYGKSPHHGFGPGPQGLYWSSTSGEYNGSACTNSRFQESGVKGFWRSNPPQVHWFSML